MYLHDNKELFDQVITLVQDETKFNKEIIIKDYYSMMLLERISSKLPDVIFKGGTCLSKAWKNIDRFSEDVDLTFEKRLTESERRNISHILQDTISEVDGLHLSNEEEIKSKSDHNIYMVSYPAEHDVEYIKDYIQIETSYFIGSFPFEKKEIKSYILEYLEKMDNKKLIEDYDLKSFTINVQSIERTFVDKVFALCDYFIRGDVRKRARHIYDLYKIYPLINKEKKLKQLIEDVRLLRREHEKCESAQNGININDVLKQIIDSKLFKEDFEQTTSAMFTSKESITYDESISVLFKIIEDDLFIQ